ncbi:MAG: T9SS type A sorting domain-containing protein [Bacteroidia bacterium]|jgi:hypothetical protein|nr:T9SS type A sorting domain-containing protein [Bacteroidia bacterium]
MKKLYTLLAFVAISATTNAQNNLIINGDFEAWTEGLPNSWFTTGSTVAQSTSVFYGGTSSISLTAPASSNKTISPTTDIPVTQAVTYVFSGWYLDNDANAKFKNWNQFRTAAGTGGTDTGSNPLQAAAFSTDSPSWQFFTAEGVPSATGTVARPGLRVYPESPTATGGVIYFDDIMFYDKSTLGVVDVKEFDNQVKMKTVVSNELKIEMPSRATVNIYSLDGKLFSSNRVNSNEAINIQSLASGVYVVTIQNDFAKTSRKFIKK